MDKSQQDVTVSEALEYTGKCNFTWTGKERTRINGDTTEIWLECDSSMFDCMKCVCQHKWICRDRWHMVSLHNRELMPLTGANHLLKLPENNYAT